jgi:hypothetical protein
MNQDYVKLHLFLVTVYSMSEVASALQKLASYRSHNSRESQDTFDKGVILLKNNAATKMGDDGAAYPIGPPSPSFGGTHIWQAGLS